MNVTLLNKSFSVNPNRGTMVADTEYLRHGRVQWQFFFACHEQDFDGEWWEPAFCVKSDSFSVRDWRDLEGQNGFFVGGGGLAHPQTHCIFEDEALHENHISIIGRQGKVFTIHLTGFAQMTRDDDNYDRIPFGALLDIEFEHVKVWGRDRASADKIVQQHLDLSGFDEPLEWRHGEYASYFYPPRDLKQTTSSGNQL